MRIGLATLLGLAVGSWLGPRAAVLGSLGDLALRLFQGGAPALIFIGLVQGLSHAEFRFRVWLRLVGCHNGCDG